MAIYGKYIKTDVIENYIIETSKYFDNLNLNESILLEEFNIKPIITKLKEFWERFKLWVKESIRKIKLNVFKKVAKVPIAKNITVKVTFKKVNDDIFNSKIKLMDEFNVDVYDYITRIREILLRDINSLSENDYLPYFNFKKYGSLEKLKIEKTGKLDEYGEEEEKYNSNEFIRIEDEEVVGNYDIIYKRYDKLYSSLESQYKSIHNIFCEVDTRLDKAVSHVIYDLEKVSKNYNGTNKILLNILSDIKKLSINLYTLMNFCMNMCENYTKCEIYNNKAVQLKNNINFDDGKFRSDVTKIYY